MQEETIQELLAPDEEAFNLTVTRERVEALLRGIDEVVTQALVVAGDNIGNVARVVHGVGVVTSVATKIEKAAKSAREDARKRLLDCMSAEGMPTVIVQTVDGKRRLSQVSQPNYATLRDDIDRADAAQALMLHEETAHLVEAKFDTRAVAKWAAGVATTEEGEFDVTLLPEHVRKHFNFAMKVTISDNKA